jgi:RNA polymerase sigma-70 factor (ECF subfamily)
MSVATRTSTPAPSLTATTAQSPTFEQSLLLLRPDLTRFARSLVGDPAAAEDLVQETITRALANRERFTVGTNLRAWTFTILRNFHFAQWHKLKRLVEWDPGLDEDLTGSGGQEAAVELSQLYAGFADLPEAQRNALALVAVQGCTYEEAADLSNCPVGTMKSRVSRARATLEAGRNEAKFAGRNGLDSFLELSRGLLARIERKAVPGRGLTDARGVWPQLEPEAG